MRIDPKQIQKAMKQMGVQQTEIDAKQVIIKLEDKELVINKPSVAIVNMMGQESFQISGDITERKIDSMPDISEEDIKTIMTQTGTTKEKARQALTDTKGDIALAIMELEEE